jgi:HEXXH motif-containing protein
MHALEPGQFERAVSGQQRLLVTRCALLPRLLAKTGDGSAARKFEALLGAVEGLSAGALLAEATPFFWLNVGRCASEALNDGDNVDELAEFVLVTALDSLFDHLPDGTAVDFGADHGCDLVLPKLGLRVPASKLPARLRRAGADSLEVTTTDGVVQLSIRTPDRPAPFSDPRIAISDATAARILLAPNLSLLDPLSALACVPASFDLTAFRTMLAEAVDWIAAVDPDVWHQMENTIKSYVPIQTNDASVHRSFTVDGLTGVMFLSESINYSLLAEAMVHEFYHTVLHIVGETEDMFGSVDPNEKFYSPWRDDPRPLSGLLHAVYVFSGVVDFYARALDHPEKPERVDFVQQRLGKLHQQLRLGLAQIPRSRLPEAADRIVRAIECQLETHALISSNTAIAEMLESHIRDWSARNPELSLARVTT